jgi:hypothetical protein
MPHSDVVIVGAGVIGSSIAYHLGKRGMCSTVVERESIGTRASGKAWAVIRYPPMLLAEKMAHRTVDAGAGVDLVEMLTGDSVENWLYLFASSYARMPDLALEISHSERGALQRAFVRITTVCLGPAVCIVELRRIVFSMSLLARCALAPLTFLLVLALWAPMASAGALDSNGNLSKGEPRDWARAATDS